MPAGLRPQALAGQSREEILRIALPGWNESFRGGGPVFRQRRGRRPCGARGSRRVVDPRRGRSRGRRADGRRAGGRLCRRGDAGRHPGRGRRGRRLPGRRDARRHDQRLRRCRRVRRFRPRRRDEGHERRLHRDPRQRRRPCRGPHAARPAAGRRQRGQLLCSAHDRRNHRGAGARGIALWVLDAARHGDARRHAGGAAARPSTTTACRICWRSACCSSR